MPFLRDEGPPIPPASIQKLRETLPVEYGWQTVNETGREVLVVRVPKAKPDYLHDLAEVAFYVGLETVRNTKDVLLVGHEKTARLEPQLLRDHIRAQGREDANVVEHLRRSLDRQYGHTFVRSPSNHEHNAFAVRIPKETVAQFTPEDVSAIRQIVASLRARVLECQYAYVVANADHERLGRRVLLELIGEGAAAAPAVEPAPAPFAPAAAPIAPVAPTPPVVPPAAPVMAAPAPAPARTPFPRADPNAPLPPAPAVAAPAPVAAPPSAPVVQAGPPSPAGPAPAGATVQEHDEYEIVTKPRAAPAPASAPTPAEPAPAASAPAVDVQEHEEYEIVSKPRAAAPPPLPAAAPAAAVPAAPHEEYEIVSKPKASTPDPAPAPAHAPEPERTVVHADKEFEVFVSKPKARPADSAPAITPPGKGGFMAALNAGTGPAPAKTKEYEIIGRTTVTSDPSIASRLRLPGANAPASPAALPVAAPTPVPVQHAPAPAAPAYTPAPHAPPAYAPPPAPAPLPAAAPPAPPPRATYEPTTAVPPRVPTTPTLPPADNGAPIVPRVAPAAPELILAQRFREVGYEIVEGLRAQGTVFAFAAHKPNGRRVLVKRAASFAPEEAASLAQLVAALGADVALVVADDVKAGTRLATWGTRIEVVTPADVPSLAF